MQHYSLRFFQFVLPTLDGDIDHREIGTYESTTPPWVPPRDSFFRFRDPGQVGGKLGSEIAGYVDEIVTVFYGTRTVIEVYLKNSDRCHFQREVP